MSIDRIYREFFGFSLIIFSLFLFGSLITFSYLDTTEDLLIVDKEFKNNFGFLGALFSTNLFFNFGLVSFYLVFILFYFGLLFFFNYSEKDAYLYVLDNINKFLLGLFLLQFFLSQFARASETQISTKCELGKDGKTGSCMFQNEGEPLKWYEKFFSSDESHCYNVVVYRSK